MRQGSVCQGQMIQGGSVFLQSFVKLPFRVAQRMWTRGQKRLFKSWSYQTLSSCVTLGALCYLSEPSSTWANSGASPLHAVSHRVGIQLCLFSSLSNRTGLITFSFLPHTCQGRRGHDAKCDSAGCICHLSSDWNRKPVGTGYSEKHPGRSKHPAPVGR